MSEHGRAPSEGGVSLAQFAFVRYGPTPTSAARRAHFASARAAYPPEGERAVARMYVPFPTVPSGNAIRLRHPATPSGCAIRQRHPATPTGCAIRHTGDTLPFADSEIGNDFYD